MVSLPTSDVTRFDVYEESYYDAPNAFPEVPIDVQTVGVNNQYVLLNLREAILGGSVPVLCNVDARVSLGATQRGIHMSRIESAFQLPDNQPMASAAAMMAEEILRTQEQDFAEVRLGARVQVSSTTPVSRLRSPDTVQISARASAGEAPSVSQSIQATIITACPCMQSYALTDVVKALGLSPQQGLELLRVAPIATHSQRCAVRLTVIATRQADLPGYDKLYDILSATTVLTQELLKRPDEYEMVRRAHLQPRFVEDVVRHVAVATARALDGARDLSMDIFAESHESIHGHDIYARICARPGEILEKLQMRREETAS